MFHFIPSWYNNDRTWYDNNYLWYFKPYHIGFDDTINQVKMFDYANQESRLLILNYMPNLRYYLHRYDLLEIDYYSIFDHIQEVGQVVPKSLDFRSLNWPKGVDFTYTPFLVVVKKDDKILAKIEFGEEGNLTHINYFVGEEIDKKYIFDDRGFLSSILYYENGHDHHQDYLTPSGDWVIREYLLADDRHVDVNPSKNFFFLRQSYPSIEDLVHEKYTRYVNHHVESSDTVIASFNQAHNSFVIDNHARAKLILSVFSERNNLDDLMTDYYALSQVDSIICDKLEMVEKLESKTDKPVIHVSPFDTRLSLGKSNQVRELTIYFVTDNMSQKALKRSMVALSEVMLKNENIRVNFTSYNRDFTQNKDLEQFLRETAAGFDIPFFAFPPSEEEAPVPFELEEEGITTPPRLTFQVLLSELDIIKSLEYIRLIVDISETPDLYTQIAGISSGIPQVNKVPTEFVEHEKNGYLIMTSQDLDKVIPYYFDGLTNWNRSLIYSVNKINDYTSGRLVAKIIDNKE